MALTGRVLVKTYSNLVKLASRIENTYLRTIYIRRSQQKVMAHQDPALTLLTRHPATIVTVKLAGYRLVFLISQCIQPVLRGSIH